MPSFSQVSCTSYLTRAESTRETFEILEAYVYSKYAKGAHPNQILRKMHLLTCYLRAINLNIILLTHSEAFVEITLVVRSLLPPSEDHRPGYYDHQPGLSGFQSPEEQQQGSREHLLKKRNAETALGREAWNEVRRLAGGETRSTGWLRRGKGKGSGSGRGDGEAPPPPLERVESWASATSVHERGVGADLDRTLSREEEVELMEGFEIVMDEGRVLEGLPPTQMVTDPSQPPGLPAYSSVPASVPAYGT
ncbi:hypothetical protein T439DRAFT_353924 [Meredithblackwellia eburnea MCA 4105]